jgi:hypothetical protein
MLRPRYGQPFDPSPWSTTPTGIAWRAMVVITVAASVVTYWQTMTGLQLDSRHLASDFVVFWTAARSAAPYDFEALTAAQYWYMATETLRPFAYPPSFLPWLEPLAGLPMWPAFLVWTGGTAALFTLVWSRIAGPIPALTGLAAPIALFGLVPGQMIFLFGSLVVGGLALADRRPVAAGLLLGAAATIKPQLLLLVPLALAAAGLWRTLAAAILAGAGIGALCLLVQGTDPWLAWIEALPRFLQVVRDTGMMEHGITPSAWLEKVEVDGATEAAARLALGAAGVFAVWVIFRRGRDVRQHILALVSGTLLVLPYAMPYELAVAAPAAASLLLDRRQAPLTWFACFAFLTAAGHFLAPALMLGTVMWLALRSRDASATGSIGGAEPFHRRDGTQSELT